MRKAILMSAAAAIAMVAVPAFAADMPVRTPRPAYKAPFAAPVYNWSGPYLGMTVGYGWGESRHDEAGVGTSGNFDVDGWLVGGTFGYNWQSGNAVFGLETDISWSNIEGNGPTGTLTAGPVRTELDWFGTLRARAGFTADASLFYVTGGLAYGDVNARGVGVGSGSDWRFGWTVGAGVETMLSQNWTAKLEYLYADLGDATFYTSAAPVRADLTNHIVRVGLNYKY